MIPGLGQLVVGDLQGEGPSAGACGAALADLSGSTLSRRRPCLPGVPLSVAAFGRRVVLGLTGGLEVYDLP